MQMDTRVNKKMWPGFLMYINHTFRNAFEGIHVKSDSIKRIKDLLQRKESVVFVPIHRSFLDLVLIMYTLYVNKIDVPFSFGSIGDVPTVAFIDKLLANSGFISVLRSRN